MTDINFILITSFTTMFSFVFFILALYEGIGKIGSIDFARTIILYISSLLASVLSIGLILSMVTPFAVSYWYLPLFFAIIDLVMVVFTSWKAYLHKVEETPSRNRRYNASAEE